MGERSKKRDREDHVGGSGDAAPAKRRRQINEEQLRLSKLYNDLAAEEDELRLEAAKQLIIKFSPEKNPSARDVETALSRLIKGLCSQRKAARIGFSLTLTELLKQIFGQVEITIAGLELDVADIIKLVEDKTKAEGNVPGRERRDHTIGRLFGYKAILQSNIVISPEIDLECWTKLLDHIYGMARDIPWLREECGIVLVEAIMSLDGGAAYEECVKVMIDKLATFKLVNTPEGIATWLTVQSKYPSVLPRQVWHDKDILSRKERSRLAKALRENYHEDPQDTKEKSVKSGGANPNPSFAWTLVLNEALRRDKETKKNKDHAAKSEFAQLWIDIVDNNLFTSTSSHERKAWGFKILSGMVAQASGDILAALFSPNLMRTLINQSKKEDRFLHTAALAALTSIPAKVKQDPSAALPIFVSLTGRHGSIDFDKITRTKTLEQILQSADDSSIKKITRHLNSLILRPETDEQALADSRRQTIADLLLNTVKQYRRYDSTEDLASDEDNWLHRLIEILVEHAYFIPDKNAKTSKVPLPSISDKTRQIFQDRLSSCLTRMMGVGGVSRSQFALMVVQLIGTKSTTTGSINPAFKADEQVSKTLEHASKTLSSISTKGTIGGDKATAEGFILLYALTLLQVYNGQGDAVMLLEDLDASRKEMSKKSKKAETGCSDVFVEIVLSFLGNPLTLFRKIGEEAFSTFAANVGPDGLQSLVAVLDTEENLEGQKELFNQEDEDVDEGESDDDSDSEGASDVEMIDGDEQDEDEGSDAEASDSKDDSDSDGQESEDDEELTRFNNMLALTLQTSKPTANGEAEEDTSDESDMDDEQMMALDPHLSKIFQQRSKTTSKKKEREDAKQNVVQFKSRVLDLLLIYLEKEYSNPLGLTVLLPIIRRTRANASKQVAEKASKLLRNHFDRKKHKEPLPKPDDVESIWELLKEIHEEAEEGGGSKMHADACSGGSLHMVKILVGLDRSHYAGVVDVYAQTQKVWFENKKSTLQPTLFAMFQNWSLTAKHGK